MPSTNTIPAGIVHRNVPDFSLPPLEDRRRDVLLRSAWVNIVSGFDCRPAPRSAWDEAATGDLTPWKKVVTPIRQAIQSAVFIGNKQLIEQTLEGARAFCRELEADFASLVPPEDEVSLVTDALEETHYQGPADEYEMAFVRDPSPITAERAVAPLSRHADRLSALVRRLRVYARSPRNQLRAVR